MHRNVVKFTYVVSEICRQIAHRQIAHRQADYNIPLSYQGGVKIL